MSANSQSRHDRFFLIPARPFLEMFVWIYYPYALFYKVWGLDWSFYEALKPWLYHPVGLIDWPAPSVEFIIGLKILGSVSAVCAMVGWSYRFSASLFFLIIFAFDVWSNAYGFINVEIHLVWMAAFLILPDLNREKRNGKWIDTKASIAFRMMELIVVSAYLQSGVSKLMASGFGWAADGTTLQIAFIRQGLWLGGLLAESDVLCKIFSWLTLLWELSFALYYLFPRMRAVQLGMGIVFHLATWMTLGIDFSHLWIFSAALLFLAPVLIGKPPRAPSMGTFVFDSECISCSWFVRLVKLTGAPVCFRAFDLCAEANEAEYTDQNGTICRGEDAVIQVLRLMGGPWRVLSSVLEIPWLSSFNRVTYQLFAKYRKSVGRQKRGWCPNPNEWEKL